MANYLKTLFTVSCERALKGDSKSEDVVVKQATQRMKKDTESYATIHKAVVFGSAIGKYLKEGSVIFEDQKIGLRLIIVMKEQITSRRKNFYEKDCCYNGEFGTTANC